MNHSTVLSGMHTRQSAAAAIFLYFAAIPLALSSDGPQADEATASAAIGAEVDKATIVDESGAKKSEGDEPATDAVANAEGSATDGDEWVCRKETPTGSHRTITACRRVKDIEADSVEVERTMNRRRHYGNPSVTPQG